MTTTCRSIAIIGRRRLPKREHANVNPGKQFTTAHVPLARCGCVEPHRPEGDDDWTNFGVDASANRVGEMIDFFTGGHPTGLSWIEHLMEVKNGDMRQMWW